MSSAIHAIEILRDRLATGWMPKADQIDPEIPQFDALNWGWSAGGLKIVFQTTDGEQHVSAEIICIDRYISYALTKAEFLWLYDDEESEKVRYLGD